MAIEITYSPQSEKALYDVCDMNGRIIYTGSICPSGITKLDTSQLKPGTYMLYILDGNHIDRQKINIP